MYAQLEPNNPYFEKCGLVLKPHYGGEGWYVYYRDFSGMKQGYDFDTKEKAEAKYNQIREEHAKGIAYISYDPENACWSELTRFWQES
jgi:hypothetical protein